MPRSRRAATALCLLTLVCQLAWLAGCHRTSADQQVREAIAASAQAVRDKDAGALGDHLSKEMVTPGQGMDRRQWLGLLRLARLRHERVTVLMGPVDTEARGDRIVARFSVTLGGGGRLIPRHLGVYRVTTAWRREDGEWRCYRATWKQRI